jgi:hypothetical protein
MKEKKNELHFSRVMETSTVLSGQCSSSPIDSVSAFIPRAVRQAEAHSGAIGLPQGLAGLGAETLLRVVTYCYAKGVVSSSEIEQRLAEDAELQTILGANIPNREEIQRFRRWNRNCIVLALEAALAEYCRASSMGAAASHELSDPLAVAHAKAEEILEEAIRRDSEEADD